MSETTEVTATAGDSSDTEGAESQFKPPASQEELDRIIQSRLDRDRKRFADYDDVKAKAGRVDELEAVKVDLEGRLGDVPTQVTSALREHLVSVHEIDAEDAELFLTASEPDLLLKQVQRLLGRESDRKKQGNVVPSEGNSSSVTGSEERAYVRSLFASGD